MKVVKCKTCNDILTVIGYTPESCQCGNVVAQYWKDGKRCTIAIKNGRDSVFVAGYHTGWFLLDCLKYQYKINYPFRYILYWPYIMWKRCQLYWRIRGRIVWHKPLEQASCLEIIGGVYFYSYD